MKILVMILLFNVVHVSEILSQRRTKVIRRKNGARLKKSDIRNRNSSEESREETSGNRTTLTFVEMVGIYHDIWNAMLLGGKT